MNSKRVIRMILMMAFFAFGLTTLTGCSGIRVNQSISPATFLLPGLLGEHKATETGEGA